MPSTFTILPRKGDNSSRGEMRWKPNLHEEHQLGRKLTSSGQTYPPVKVIRMSPSERYFGSIVLTTSPTASVSEDKYSPGSRSKLQDRKTAENGARLQEKRSCSRPVRQRCIKLAECVEVDRKTSFAAKHKIFNKFVVISFLRLFKEICKTFFQIYAGFVRSLHPCLWSLKKQWKLANLKSQITGRFNGVVALKNWSFGGSADKQTMHYSRNWPRPLLYLWRYVLYSTWNTSTS